MHAVLAYILVFKRCHRVRPVYSRDFTPECRFCFFTWLYTYQMKIRTYRPGFHLALPSIRQYTIVLHFSRYSGLLHSIHKMQRFRNLERGVQEIYETRRVCFPPTTTSAFCVFSASPTCCIWGEVCEPVFRLRPLVAICLLVIVWPSSGFGACRSPRRRMIVCICNWHTRDSETLMTLLISFIVSSS